MLRSSTFLFFLPLFILPAAQASVDSSLAVKFYRTPHSLFPSGEINRRDLEKNWQQDFAESSYMVRREKRQFWVKAASVARDLSLSQLVFSSRTQKTYRVQQISGASALVTGEGQSAEWISFSELSPLPQDLGVAMTLTNTQLHESANWKSDTMINIPPGSRLTIHKIEDSWVKVTFESVGKISGWVDLNNLIFKYDYAAFALTDNKTWTPILYREGTDLVTVEKKKIPLERVRGLMTKPDLAISLVTDDAENLLLRQNLTLLETDFQTWSLSKIQGHGPVYWKKSQAVAVHEEDSDQGLTVEQLMERDLVAISFHPQNPNMAVASAQGIFLTTDGKIWKKLRTFQNQNHPVLIDAQSNLYVGTQRSLDLGKSFNPYFRLEALAPLVEQRQKSVIQQLKIRRLTSPRPGILRMEVETNLGSLALAARADSRFIQKWDFD